MTTQKKIGILILVLLFISQGGGVSAKVDMAVVVYESAEAPLRPYVWGALNRLEDSGLQVRAIDDDVTTGTDEQPRQVKAAIVAARENGLPALVLMSGEAVKSTLDLPKSSDAIVEAAN